MKTTLEVLKLSTDFLAERNIDRPRRTAEEIISHTLGLKRLELYLKFDQPILEAELSLIRSHLKRILKGEPLEYILGQIEFFGAQIKIDSRALIPRPETEILVDLISKQQPQGTLWDICTGSGCIGISLKKAHPHLNVTLSDLSQEALALAQTNATLNQVELTLLHGDLLTPFQGQKADVIVCNPPYISQAEFDALDPSVRNFEPTLALLGGLKGSEIYERLQQELPAYLNPGATVYFEIGSTQAPILLELFPEGTLKRDWAGHPRFFIVKTL